VYILLLSNNLLYVGFTDDLRRRYYEYSQGKVKSTKNLRPLKLIFYETFINKNDAVRREKYFKTDKGKKMIKVVLREYFAAIV
jgi:putative endonuclease